MNLNMFAAVGMSLLCLASAASAQTAAPVATDKGQLQDIVVTAQKRGENLQRVPIAVTAITADAAKAQGITGIVDLAGAVPALVITPSVGNPVMYLRGVGTDQVSGGTESSIATYVDGVYMANLPSTLFSFNNIERIEVLKGPQGTLFGRNATGGLVNIITRDPGREARFDLSAGYGNYNTAEGQIYASTPLGDKIAIDFSAYGKRQGDGWGTNLFDGSAAYRDRTYALRAKQLLTLWEGGRITFSEDFAELHGSTSADRQPLPGSFGIGQTPNTGSFYDVNVNYPSYEVFKGGGGSARIEQNLGGVKLMDIVAYRRSMFDNYLDQDGTPLAATNSYQHYTNHYVSNELQLQSGASSRVKWIGGLYYLSMLDRLDPLILAGTSQAANGGSLTTTGSQKTHSYAGFAQATVPLGEKINLTGGLRYTHDERLFHGETTTSARGLITVVNADKTWGSWSYKATVDYHPVSHVMVYVTESDGFKSGQFNIINPTNPPVNPEHLTSTEGGVKSQLLDNRLRLNLAGFYYDYKNLQLNERTASGLSQVLNAASATIYGFEASALARPVEHLTLRGDMALLHARYDSFTNAPYLLPSPAACTPTPHSTGAPTGGNTTCTFNASGNTMVRAPTATFNVGARFDRPVGSGTAYADLSLYRTSGSFFNPDNRLKQAPYSIVNGEIAFDRKEYVIRLWAKNLLDEHYYSFLAESIGDYFTPGAPRTFGATVELHFH